MDKAIKVEVILIKATMGIKSEVSIIYKIECNTSEKYSDSWFYLEFPKAISVLRLRVLKDNSKTEFMGERSAYLGDFDRKISLAVIVDIDCHDVEDIQQLGAIITIRNELNEIGKYKSTVYMLSDMIRNKKCKCKDVVGEVEVKISSNREVVKYMENIIYFITIINNSNKIITNIEVDINIPNNTCYVDKSLEINKVMVEDYAGGKVYISTIKAKEIINISYMVKVNEIPSDGKIINSNSLFLEEDFIKNKYLSNTLVTTLRSGVVKSRRYIERISENEILIKGELWNIGNEAVVNVICKEIIPEKSKYISNSLVINEEKDEMNDISSIKIPLIYPLQIINIKYKLDIEMSKGDIDIDSKISYS